LDSIFKIYQDLHISEVSTLSLYENPFFSITLRVIKDDLEESWLHLRKSSIPNSGFGVFAARPFQKMNSLRAILANLLMILKAHTYSRKKMDVLYLWGMLTIMEIVGTVLVNLC
jgi:hypothetical protein